eukprot:scaffold18609_cov91-Phaeocystis_antarctica.AAC.2
MLVTLLSSASGNAGNEAIAALARTNCTLLRTLLRILSRLTPQPSHCRAALEEARCAVRCTQARDPSGRAARGHVLARVCAPPRPGEAALVHRLVASHTRRGAEGEPGEGGRARREHHVGRGRDAGRDRTGQLVHARQGH